MSNLAPLADTKFGLPAMKMSPGLAIMFNDALYGRCIDMAKIMADARGFTPVHLIGKSAACFAVITNSITWNLPPFQVAQSTYETPGGKVGYEGKLVQAILENSGAVEGGVTFEHFGDWTKVQGKWTKGLSSRGNAIPVQAWKDADEEGLGVIVRIKVRGEHKPREFTMHMRECYPRNSTLWALRPSQQICYTAVRAAANVIAPGIFMGVPFSTDLDMEEIQDITPARPQREAFESSTKSAPKVADPATNEPEENAPLMDDSSVDEYSVADAYEKGQADRVAGKALRAIPPEWRDNPAMSNFVEGWQEGWRAKDDELKTSK